MNKLLFGAGFSVFLIELLFGVSYGLTQIDSTTLKVFGLVGLNLIAAIFMIVGALHEE